MLEKTKKYVINSRGSDFHRLLSLVIKTIQGNTLEGDYKTIRPKLQFSDMDNFVDKLVITNYMVAPTSTNQDTLIKRVTDLIMYLVITKEVSFSSLRYFYAVEDNLREDEDLSRYAYHVDKGIILDMVANNESYTDVYNTIHKVVIVTKRKMELEKIKANKKYTIIN